MGDALAIVKNATKVEIGSYFYLTSRMVKNNSFLFHSFFPIFKKIVSHLLSSLGIFLD